MVLPEIDKDAVRDLIERTMLALEEQAIEHKASSVSDIVTISVGHSFSSLDDDLSWSALIDKADANLYIAKQRGRAQLVSSRL
jgi:PleD family two-component response regulator